MTTDTNITTERELLRIEDLNISFHSRHGVIRAIRNMSIQINEGETLALVGESGCGKSVTAHAITRLIPMPPGEIESGKIYFQGTDLLTISDKEMCALRGSKISMVFQEPMTSLNPVFTIGTQIADVFLSHEKIGKKEAHEKAVELLNLVKIPDPGKRAKTYPHQLSGGMRQRAMIAMALASPNPGLIIADEPTTALDVTIQAQVLQLLGELKSRVGMAILLITHDMGVVAETADRVVVMYAGHKVEDAPVRELFANPRHPYTTNLLCCQPSAQGNRNATRLTSISGSVPNLLTLGNECPFVNRCMNVSHICQEHFPEQTKVGDNHNVWCHNPVNKGGMN